VSLLSLQALIGHVYFNHRAFRGFIDLGAGLAVGISGLAAGFAIGIVGDSGVRGTAQQPRVSSPLKIISPPNLTVALMRLQLMGCFVVELFMLGSCDVRWFSECFNESWVHKRASLTRFKSVFTTNPRDCVSFAT
jgi:F0F1-type ATP synthase membrane subunit c/vacuolar-type H+-ATPase subunit K